MKKRGSISIFLAMIMIPVVSFFLVLSEGVRIISLKKLSKNTINSSKHYLNSMYQSMLFDEYKIMAIDINKGKKEYNIAGLENDVRKFLVSYTDPDEDGDSFFRMRVSDCELQNIGKLTDDFGKPFIKLAVISEKDNLAKTIIDSSKEYFKKFKETENRDTDIDKKIDDAKKTLIEEKEKAEKSKDREANSKTYLEKDVRNIENPLDSVSSRKEEKNLTFWTGDNKKISNQKLISKNTVSKRRIVRKKTSNVSISVVDKVIYYKYLHDKMGNFIKPNKHNGLEYGVEYVICGKDSDKENLKSIIHKIMAIREANNSLTIIKSSSLNAKAEALAVVIAGATLNPSVIKSVKYGIIASWAYVESVLDIRTLLNGGKVSFIKKEADFTSSLGALPMYLHSNYKAKENTKGVNYKKYLTGFLSLLSIKKLGLRPQDIIEDEFSRIKLCKYFNMDYLAYECDVSINFGAKPIFLGLTNLKDKDKRYGYVENTHVSFIKSN